ncbi:MAG: tetratricopeptide repeat protein [Pirellulaceae bacterium]
MTYVRSVTMIVIITIGTTGCHSLHPTNLGSTAQQSITTSTADGTAPPDTADVQIGLGRMYEKQGSRQAAMNAYVAALRHAPDHPNAHWRLGVLYDKLGDFASAEQSFRKSLTLNPLNPDCLCDYGYSLYLQARWQDAEETLREALSIDHSHRRSHNILGIIKARHSQFSQANHHFQQAGCTQAECEENIAFAMILDNRLEQARDHYERALQLNPQSKKSQDNLEVLTPQLAERSSGNALP